MAARFKKTGFTLIELLVVIAIIALLLAVVMPALGKAKVYAQKVICCSNMRQQALGVNLYANDNQASVPVVTGDPANWLWDITFWTTNQISDFAGFDDNNVFFCSANKTRKPDDARFWQFSLIGTVTGPQPLRDESGLSIAQQKANYRVPPVLYMVERLKSDGTSKLPTLLETNKKPQWISKLSKVKNTAGAILIMDNVLSNASKDKNVADFFQVKGGSYDKYQEYDPSNHKSTTRNSVGFLPDGANVAYADGHVTWKHFSEMECQITTMGPYFWW